MSILTSTQKELFVEFPLAKLAKEKGFNLPCIACYMTVDDILDHPELNEPPVFAMFGDYGFPNKLYTELYNDFNKEKKKYGAEIISAPMRHDLMKWLEDRHGVVISPFENNNQFKGKISLNPTKNFNNTKIINLSNYETENYLVQNDALDEAISQTLKHL